MTWVYSYHPLHHQKRNHNWREFVFTVRAATSFSNDQLSLHGSGILLMRKVAPASRLALASISGMHTNLLVPSLLKINKMILTLGPY